MVPTVAALMIIFMLSIVYYNNNLAVYAVVTVDINPSVELKLNAKDQVVEAVAINQDALSLDIDELKGMSVEEAVLSVIDLAEAQGFIGDDVTSYVALTTVLMKNDSKEEHDKLKVKLTSSVEDIVQEEVKVVIGDSTVELLNEAIETEVPLALLNFKDEVDIDVFDTVREFF